MMDMLFVLIPSIIVALGTYYYLKKYGKEKIMDEMVRDSPAFSQKMV
jgi:hypothetical protein